MTTTDEKPTLPALRTYEEGRRSQMVSRIRWAAALALVPIALAVPINLWVFPETVVPRLVLLGVVAVLCLCAPTLTRIPLVAARPDAIAIAFVLAVAVATGRLILQSAEDLDVFVGVVTASMLTTALFFPWTVRSQVVVSTVLGAAYLWLLVPMDVPSARLANVVIALFDGIFLSVVGAYTLDEQRRATFDEREQAASLAAQREQLLDVGHELNEVLDVSALGARIVRRGRALVEVDTCALVLVDPDGGSVRTAALDGHLPPALQAILDREATASIDQPFFLELRRHASLEIPGGPLDALASDLREHYGIHHLLLAPVQREDAFLGYLAFFQLRPGPPCTAAQRRLAAGLAQLSAVALANARLVTALQRANHVKNEFVSTMSHELRTPLGVIMGYAEILEDGDPALWSDAVARIKRSSAELLEMIEGTLNLNRLESGRDAPSIAPLTLVPFWDELATELAALPRAPGVTLRFAPAPDAMLATDRRKLRIVVKNLVGNALKFTARGIVEATCSLDADGCTISVRDSGIGIAPEDVSAIFEMYRQADSSDRRAYGGVGLGLHIVQRLVEQLGGRVEVESELGVGSTFRVTLPGRAVQAAA